MDLSEHALTIVHRAGPSMHLADALSRCGYSKDYATSTVELVKQHPMEACTVQEMRKYFTRERQQNDLEGRIKAAGGAQVTSIKEAYDRLADTKAECNLVPESDEEESRTVQLYDMIMAVPTSRRKSARLKEQQKAQEQARERAMPYVCPRRRGLMRGADTEAVRPHTRGAPP